MYDYALKQLNDFFNDSDFLFSNSFKDPFHFIKDETIKYPAIDMAFDDSKLYITIAVCGIKKDDLSLELKENVLYVNYEPKKDNTESGKLTYLRHKISKKKFNLMFKIHQKCDLNNIESKVENGELLITIPYKENEQKIKKLEIK